MHFFWKCYVSDQSHLSLCIETRSIFVWMNFALIDQSAHVHRMDMHSSHISEGWFSHSMTLLKSGNVILCFIWILNVTVTRFRCIILIQTNLLNYFVQILIIGIFIEIPYTRLLMPSLANIPHRTDLVQCVTLAITVTEKDMTETENNLGHAWKSIYSFFCVLSSVQYLPPQ